MKDEVQVRSISISGYVELLKRNHKFSYTRWGDGEWGCVFGAEGQNIDKHKYFPEMAECLRTALKNDKGYQKATWPYSAPMLNNIKPQVEEYLSKHKLSKDWYDARVWEDACLDSTIDLLVQQMETMNVVFITEPDKRKLPIKYVGFIDIPSVDCFLAKEDIKTAMRTALTQYDDIVFAFSASMATNVIVDEMYDEIGDRCWMIDFGSIWEPLIGKITRSYHRLYPWKLSEGTEESASE
jgi:hypothetical protein|tara:strand:+ start:6066 stop:6782 length:717 start_codon:yes stop_codon:yes gene_type:complete